MADYVYPVSGTWAAKGSSPWGAAREGGGRHHSGNDLQARNGSPAVAVIGGKVLFVSNDPGGYDHYAIVQGDDGNMYRYAPHAAISVKAGQRVEQGAPIGTIGRGHLHFEVAQPNDPGWGRLKRGEDTQWWGKAAPLTSDPAKFFGVKPGTAIAAGQTLGSGAVASNDIATRDFPVAGQAAAPAATSIEAYVRQAAIARGIDPNVAVRVVRSEGGLKDPTQQSYVVRNGQRETSYGPFQLRINGGLGDQALRAGIDPRKPEDWQKGVDFALNYAAQHGWGEWYGAGAVGLSNSAGITKDSHPVAIGTAAASPVQEATFGTPLAAGYVVPSDPTAQIAGGGASNVMAGGDVAPVTPPAGSVFPFTPSGGPVGEIHPLQPALANHWQQADLERTRQGLAQMANVPSGETLSPYVRGDFFGSPPVAPPASVHSTPQMSYNPLPTTIQPYSTQAAAQIYGQRDASYQQAPQDIGPAVQHVSGPTAAPVQPQGYGANPAMGAAAASGLQGYAPGQLPIAPSDIQQQGFMGGVPGEPAQMPAAAPAATGGVGGFLHQLVQSVAPIAHQVVQTIQTGVMPGGQSLGGFLSGISSFGGGPLPGGVSDQAGFSHFLQSQNWEGPGTSHAGTAFSPGSGGATYQYFTPSQPGGIGGYVVPAGHPNAGTVYTYDTSPGVQANP